MGEKSKIEWTDATWNPIRARVWEIQNDGSGKERVGWHCEHVSEGCRNCYAEAINRRLGTGRDFKPGELFREERVGYHNGDVKVFLDEKMLTAPLRWKKPRRIFVNSMTDTFAEFVTDEMLDRIFAVMALCSQHTFQVLTKRSVRMRKYCTHMMTPSRIALAAPGLPQVGREVMVFNATWPLPNVWLGVSAERQQEADERMLDLLATPAAVRFVSLEPLLGAINLEARLPHPVEPPTWGKLRWVIVGGESGPRARPMHLAWARSLRDQCRAAGVPFFFKQHGEWAPHTPQPGGDLGGDCRADRVRIVHRVEHSDEDLLKRSFYPGDTWAKRVGKKAAGRLLDGAEHNEMPGVAA